MSKVADTLTQNILHTVRCYTSLILLHCTDIAVDSDTEVYCYVRSPYKDLFVYDTVVQVRFHVYQEDRFQYNLRSMIHPQTFHPRRKAAGDGGTFLPVALGADTDQGRDRARCLGRPLEGVILVTGKQSLISVCRPAAVVGEAPDETPVAGMDPPNVAIRGRAIKGIKMWFQRVKAWQLKMRSMILVQFQAHKPFFK